MDDELKSLKEANNLTDDEIQNFYKELENIPSMKAPLTGKQAVLCCKFMEDTGCRVNETIHVKKKDIDFGTRILTVTEPKVEHTCKCSVWEYRDLQSRIRVLKSSDSNCSRCHGKGKWKKPQATTITPRIVKELREYCDTLKDDDILFPVHRYTLWKWFKRAGVQAGIRIFQRKEEKIIKGVFLHLFRALCSKRMTKDAMNDPFKDQLVAKKLRHSFGTVTDRYTKIDINYLWNWEEKTYSTMK